MEAIRLVSLPNLSKQRHNSTAAEVGGSAATDPTRCTDYLSSYRPVYRPRR